jgi:hypothetical protein
MPITGGDYFQGSGVQDLSSISQLNMGIDPGAFATTPYSVSFNDLSFTNVTAPEPGSLSTMALGLLLLARRRRRTR